MNNVSFFKALPALIWQVLFFCVPLCLILLLSFYHLEQGTVTLANYLPLFGGAYAKIIGRSLLVAACTSLLCFIIGYPIGYYITLKKPSWKYVLLFFLILPFWINVLVLTYAWFFMLDRDGIINTVLLYTGLIHEPITLLNNIYATLAVMVYCYLPFMIMPIVSVLEKFDVSLIDASKDLGASGRQTFLYVIFPLSLSGICTGFLLVFVPAFGEFVIPMLVGGDKHMFVGSVISHYFFIGKDYARASAFTVVSSALLLTIIALMHWFITFWVRRRTTQPGDAHV